MRFELHTSTWIPIKSRFLPVGRLAGRTRRGSPPGCACWNNSLCLWECCDLASRSPPVIDSELLGCWCTVTERLSHLGLRPAVRRLRRFLVKSSCARGRAWLTIDFGSHPWKDTVSVRFHVGILVSFNLFHRNFVTPGNPELTLERMQWLFVCLFYHLMTPIFKIMSINCSQCVVQQIWKQKLLNFIFNGLY